MRDIVQVDGSPGTVAALLRCGVRSPRTVACLLHLSHRSASYYRRPAASMSCTYLMPVIHCVDLSHTHLMRCMHRVPGEAMMSLMSGVLGTHGHTRGPPGTWRLQSPPAPGGGSGATVHVVVPEPCRAVVLVPRSHSEARVFLRRGGPGAMRHMATPKPSHAE
jgi:hypothetical protein